MASLKEILAAKKQAAAPAPVSAPAAGLIIKPAAVMTPKEQALASLPALKEIVIPAPEVRELGNPKPEGGIPFVFPSVTDSADVQQWLQFLQVPETRLGIWIEPSMEGAWLALENPAAPGKPLLILRMRTLNVWGERPF